VRGPGKSSGRQAFAFAGAFFASFFAQAKKEELS
jgi:hypothetical protein